MQFSCKPATLRVDEIYRWSYTNVASRKSRQASLLEETSSTLVAFFIGREHHADLLY